jgi:hypothetical protein
LATLNCAIEQYPRLEIQNSTYDLNWQKAKSVSLFYLIQTVFIDVMDAKHFLVGKEFGFPRAKRREIVEENPLKNSV